jgi:hypothetical protein
VECSVKLQAKTKRDPPKPTSYWKGVRPMGLNNEEEKDSKNAYSREVLLQYRINSSMHTNTETETHDAIKIRIENKIDELQEAMKHAANMYLHSKPSLRRTFEPSQQTLTLFQYMQEAEQNNIQRNLDAYESPTLYTHTIC